MPNAASPSSCNDSAWASPKSTPLTTTARHGPDPTAPAPEQPGQGPEQHAAEEQLFEERCAGHRGDHDQPVADAVGATGQALGRGREALVEVVDVGPDRDVDESHDELAGHTDRDAQQVDPPEAQSEVGHEALGPAQPAGQDRRPEEAAPQAEEGGQHEPRRRLGQLRQGGELVVLAGERRRRSRRTPPPAPARRGSRARRTAATSRRPPGPPGWPRRRAAAPRETSGAAEAAGRAGDGDGGTGIGCRLGWCARSRGIHRLFGPVAHSPTIPTAPPGGVPGPTVGGDASGRPRGA